mmetsp:Transcript_45280/g.121202  ORF Transcript_45280/g.121202 Transcript_45280/m.121202 type:complete len:201 (+) Transcript_45280:272-874(+)
MKASGRLQEGRQRIGASPELSSELTLARETFLKFQLRDGELLLEFGDHCREVELRLGAGWRQHQVVLEVRTLGDAAIALLRVLPHGDLPRSRAVVLLVGRRRQDGRLQAREVLEKTPVGFELINAAQRTRRFRPSSVSKLSKICFESTLGPSSGSSAEGAPMTPTTMFFSKQSLPKLAGASTVTRSSALSFVTGFGFVMT